MNELIQIFYLVLPWALALLIPFVSVMALVVGRNTALYWVAAYFVLIFFFPNASWGVVETAAAGQNFYTRGVGLFYFSAINVMLFGLTIQAFFARRIGLPVAVQHNLRMPALAYLAILVGQIVVGLATPGLRWYHMISYSGLLNAFNFMLAFYVLTSALRQPKDLERFLNLLLACVVMRGLWGIARFVALGGDPANFYQNFQHVAIRITFFDINDSLLATLALFIAAWRLVRGQCTTAASTTLHTFIVVLELFIIVFSYRRTAWGGLALAAIFFAYIQRRSVRNWLAVGYAFFGLPLLLYKMIQRSGDATRGAGIIERMLPDIVKHGHFDFTAGRFAELYAAWLSFKESPILGLGAWGRYDGFRFGELSWHRGDFSWMHSGLLHILLKSGLVGAFVFLAAVWLFASFVWKHRAEFDDRQRSFAYAGVAGCLLMLPVWLVGTPVIEFRTMQLVALCVALPYVALAASRAARAEPGASTASAVRASPMRLSTASGMAPQARRAI